MNFMTNGCRAFAESRGPLATMDYAFKEALHIASKYPNEYHLAKEAFQAEILEFIQILPIVPIG
jgi:hypothetical protein